MLDGNEFVPLSTLHDQALHRLYAEWQQRRKGRAFPARADFDPLEMKYVVGKLSLIEVRHHPLRFFFRVHAGGAAERLGFDLTRKFLDDYPDIRHRDLIHDHFICVLAEGMPISIRRDAQATDNHVLQCEATVLPLAKDGQSIDMLITGFAWRG